MTEVLSAFIATTIITVFKKKIVHAFHCLIHDGFFFFFWQVTAKGGQKYILGAPDCPVVHLAMAVAHPPKMFLEIWGKDTFLQILVDHFWQKGADA